MVRGEEVAECVWKAVRRCRAVHTRIPFSLRLLEMAAMPCAAHSLSSRTRPSVKRIINMMASSACAASAAHIGT